jgi:hypothetical protein
VRLLLFVSVLAVLACLGVVIAAVLASKRRQDDQSKPDEKITRGKF